MEQWAGDAACAAALDRTAWANSRTALMAWCIDRNVVRCRKLGVSVPLALSGEGLSWNIAGCSCCLPSSSSCAENAGMRVRSFVVREHAVGRRAPGRARTQTCMLSNIVARVEATVVEIPRTHTGCIPFRRGCVAYRPAVLHDIMVRIQGPLDDFMCCTSHQPHR